jgi:Zn-dependent protease with chaperone function
MDFFDKQENARRRTKWLVLYFALAVLGIIAVLHIALSTLLGEPLDDWRLLGATAAGVGISVAIGSLVKIAQLSKGGKAVAEMLGGVPVNPSTTDPAERRLMNVVEEMSLASGVPVPQVYVLEDSAINAFAAGYGPGDAAMGVTRGCIEQLNRDELQGVVGHEFSHILNGDMRLNIHLMGLLNGILFLAIIGGLLMRLAATSSSRPRSGNDKSGTSLAMVFLAGGLILYLVGWIGVFFGKLIKAAVSRQREFLADASAVQYTRNPDGLAGALTKIAKFSSQLQHPKAQEASHMFFGNGIANPWLGLFATHPPIAERIAQIAPNFDAERVAIKPPPLPREAPSPSGDPRIAAAVSLLAGLPEFSTEATHDVNGACALFYSFLLSRAPETRGQELSLIAVDDSMRQAVCEMFERRNELSSAQRFALADLAIPALRAMSPGQYQTFRSNVLKLIEADGQIQLFEYTLQKVLLRHLDAAFTKAKPERPRYRSLVPLLPDINVLLSAVANADDGDGDALNAAFQAGVASLGAPAGAFPLARQPRIDLRDFDAALDHAALATPAIKKSLLSACGAVVMQDGIVNDTQFELLRAIADTVGFPLPPHIPTA